MRRKTLSNEISSVAPSLLQHAHDPHSRYFILDELKQTGYGLVFLQAANLYIHFLIFCAGGTKAEKQTNKTLQQPILLGANVRPSNTAFISILATEQVRVIWVGFFVRRRHHQRKNCVAADDSIVHHS